MSSRVVVSKKPGPARKETITKKERESHGILIEKMSPRGKILDEPM
jgi:hypothetical protein